MSASNKKYDDDDNISFCSSIAGDNSVSSLRRLKKKNSCPLRQHSVELPAHRLSEFSFDNNLNNSKNEQKKSRFNKVFHHYRFLVVILGGLSFGIMLLLRFSVAVAILNMVNHTAVYLEENPDNTLEDFLSEGNSITDGEFVWDNEIQHMIMSWYMIAYTLPQVFTTKLGLIIGSRLTVPISLSICAIATLLTPTAAYLGWEYVIGLRLINGIGASAILPMMLNSIETWMPYNEISLGLTVAQIVQSILNSSTPLIAGYLASFHWVYAFYVPGIFGIIFSMLWLILISDRPDENRFISDTELDIICGCSNNNLEEGRKNDTNELKTPKQDVGLKDVMKLSNFYAYMLVMSLYCSAFNGFTFVLPTYLRQYLHIEVSQNGLYCSIISSGMIVSVMWPHPVIRLLQARFNLSLTCARRITYSVACLVLASTWLYVGSYHEYQLALLFLNRSFNGCNDVVVTGSLMNNYANAGLSSLVFSICNTVGNLSVVFVSTFIGWLLDETSQSDQGWLMVFGILSTNQILIVIIFSTLIRSEPIEFHNNKIEQKQQQKDVECTPEVD